LEPALPSSWEPMSGVGTIEDCDSPDRCNLKEPNVPVCCSWREHARLWSVTGDNSARPHAPTPRYPGSYDYFVLGSVPYNPRSRDESKTSSRSKRGTLRERSQAGYRLVRRQRDNQAVGEMDGLATAEGTDRAAMQCQRQVDPGLLSASHRCGQSHGETRHKSDDRSAAHDPLPKGSVMIITSVSPRSSLMCHIRGSAIWESGLRRQAACTFRVTSHNSSLTNGLLIPGQHTHPPIRC
jgi:hypothetical protein